MCLSGGTDTRWTKSSSCYQGKYKLLVPSGVLKPALILSHPELEMLIKAVYFICYLLTLEGKGQAGCMGAFQV